eukprot:4007828-Pleurochrysis_carterae.AAC.2
MHAASAAASSAQPSSCPSSSARPREASTGRRTSARPRPVNCSPESAKPGSGPERLKLVSDELVAQCDSETCKAPICRKRRS